MSSSTWLWLAVTLLCIVVQGIYSMLEVASISFNRVRLQYYVSRGIKRACWLQRLLQEPSRLFGAVMLGVNLALQVGSQSARELYRSFGLNPDWAPLTQIFFVVIVAELAPCFAARRYAEHVVMLGMPLLYATERLFSPLIWLIGKLTKWATRLSGVSESSGLLSREEIQHVIENQEDNPDNFSDIVFNLFSLRHRTIKELMVPLAKVEMVRSNVTIGALQQRLKGSTLAHIPVYHDHPSQIVAMAYIRDLVRPPMHYYVRNFSRPPWFITESMQLMQVLKQFRENKQTVAVVLDTAGATIGLLERDKILQAIFGNLSEGETRTSSVAIIDRTFPGNFSIREFNETYSTQLQGDGATTLAQLLFLHLGHMPERGESVVIDGLEFTAEETSLLGTKLLSVHSVSSQRE